jgi:DNA invertase Pin-like site-specific DNA recombinase
LSVHRRRDDLELVDEARRQLISRRVRESIAERKRAGTYHGSRPRISPATANTIVDLRRRGWSLRRIAWALDRSGRPPVRGGLWRHSTVRLVLLREAPELLGRRD